MIDGKTGYLLDPYDFDGFTEKIVMLLENSDLRDQLGQQAKEYVRERFLITRHLLDYMNLMLSL
jgi:trehalose synthase